MPDEPPEGCTEMTCALRIRAPNREMLTRKFYGRHGLQVVINFITSKGYHLSEFKLLTTFPRRDVSIIDYFFNKLKMLIKIKFYDFVQTKLPRKIHFAKERKMLVSFPNRTYKTDLS